MLYQYPIGAWVLRSIQL